MRSRTLGVVAALAVTMFAPSFVSADDFGFREYTYGASNCTGIKDPINFYFGKDLGFLAAATDVIEDTVTWRASPIGGNQWFRNDGVCEQQNRQRAEFILALGRHHTRMSQGRRLDAQFQHITASPMHHDSAVVGPGCVGEVADSFNSSRNLAAQRIQAAGWFAVFTQTGNNALIRQCDGRLTGSDGRYVLARN